jgi:hypothetical protein
MAGNLAPSYETGLAAGRVEKLGVGARDWISVHVGEEDLGSEMVAALGRGGCRLMRRYLKRVMTEPGG